jgi:hypothetical protein
VLSTETGAEALRLSTITNLLLGFELSGIIVGSTFGDGIAEVN